MKKLILALAIVTSVTINASLHTVIKHRSCPELISHKNSMPSDLQIVIVEQHPLNVGKIGVILSLLQVHDFEIIDIKKITNIDNLSQVIIITEKINGNKQMLEIQAALGIERYFSTMSDIRSVYPYIEQHFSHVTQKNPHIFTYEDTQDIRGLVIQPRSDYYKKNMWALITEFEKYKVKFLGLRLARTIDTNQKIILASYQYDQHSIITNIRNDNKMLYDNTLFLNDARHKTFIAPIIQYLKPVKKSP